MLPVCFVFFVKMFLSRLLQIFFFPHIEYFLTFLFKMIAFLRQQWVHFLKMSFSSCFYFMEHVKAS